LVARGLIRILACGVINWRTRRLHRLYLTIIVVIRCRICERYDDIKENIKNNDDAEHEREAHKLWSSCVWFHIRELYHRQKQKPPGKGRFLTVPAGRLLEFEELEYFLYRGTLQLESFHRASEPLQFISAHLLLA